MLRYVSRLLAGVAFAATLGASVAQAQNTTTLKYAQIFPPVHYIWTQFGEVFAERVTKLTDGKFKFELYPSGQLGKDYVGLLRNGLADAVLLVPSVAADKLPLTSVAELPQAVLDTCEATRKLWSVTKRGGIIYENEYKPLGIEPLFVTVLPGYQILTTNTPLKAVENVAGLKIRGVGAAMDKTARALGAVAIQIASPELFDALSRGTVDGALWGYLSSPQFGVVGSFKHGIEGLGIGSLVVVVGMSSRTWNSLPPDVQDKVRQAAKETQASFCKWTAAQDLAVRQEMMDKHGYAPTILSKAEVDKWQPVVNQVSDEWAREMDKTGRPGSAVLKAYREASGD